MSYQEDKLTTIANAIRGLKGTSGSITASNFASEITAYKTALNGVLPVGAHIVETTIPGNPQSILGGTWKLTPYLVSPGSFINCWKRTA